MNLVGRRRPHCTLTLWKEDLLSTQRWLIQFKWLTALPLPAICQLLCEGSADCFYFTTSLLSMRLRGRNVCVGRLGGVTYPSLRRWGRTGCRKHRWEADAHRGSSRRRARLPGGRCRPSGSGRSPLRPTPAARAQDKTRQGQSCVESPRRQLGHYVYSPVDAPVSTDRDWLPDFAFLSNPATWRRYL